LPKDFQDCILVADLPRDSIFRLKLEREGEKLSVVSSDLFANLPRPVGIAFDGDRSLFVITRRPDNKLYRLTFDE
jgi:glucose/arabinose dehydrogenase